MELLQNSFFVLTHLIHHQPRGRNSQTSWSLRLEVGILQAISTRRKKTLNMRLLEATMSNRRSSARIAPQLNFSLSAPWSNLVKYRKHRSTTLFPCMSCESLWYASWCHTGGFRLMQTQCWHTQITKSITNTLCCVHCSRVLEKAGGSAITMCFMWSTGSIFVGCLLYYSAGSMPPMNCLLKNCH
jgi:hypothetical protein